MEAYSASILEYVLAWCQDITERRMDARRPPSTLAIAQATGRGLREKGRLSRFGRVSSLMWAFLRISPAFWRYGFPHGLKLSVHAARYCSLRESSRLSRSVAEHSLTAGLARISGCLYLDMDPRLIKHDPAPSRTGNLREKLEARDSLVLDALKPAHHRLAHAEDRGQGRLWLLWGRCFYL